MFKRSVLSAYIAFALVSGPGVAQAYEVEAYGFIKNESSVFVRSGQVTGQARDQLDRRDYSAGEVLKFENSARVFLNGDVGEESSWHLDLNMIYDTEGVNSFYKGYQPYTQHDWLREAYLDTSAGPVDMRLGKQQVVWGTADGIKLLDIINPTDFREFVQNTMEDSRIPVWMGKAELDVGDTGNFQFLVSQREENKYPGLSKPRTGGTKVVGTAGNPFAPGFQPDNSEIRGVDRDQAFIALGTDSITGGVNGFRNISPALGAVSNTFSLGASGIGSPVGLAPFTFLTVQDFVDGAPLPPNPFVPAGTPAPAAFGCGSLIPAGGTTGDVQGNADCLSAIANITNQYITNLIDSQTGGTWDQNNPNSAFEYFNNATFATFNTFVGARSNWDRDYPDDLNLNYGTRYKDSLFGGSLNFSLNYLYAYDTNPTVKLRWKNDSGETLNTEYLEGTGLQGQTTRTVILTDSQDSAYGAFDARTGAPGAGPATLEFEETVHRVHNYGASFDSSFDVGVVSNPVVLRGEFLYQKDVRVPLIDRSRLGIGDLVGGLRPVKNDFFKYVVGLDFLVWTNLTVSTQFIQFVNLDYEKHNKDTFTGESCTDANCGRYTADPGTLHLTNGLQDGQEHDNFYSLFLSKPFGPSQLGRVNNIILYESGRGGGYWNRLDVEYQFTDEFVATAEWNQYWGDDNSLFGQFDKSSNVQVGLKYIFE